MVALVAEMRRASRDYLGDGQPAPFNAEQDALVVKNAEHYYRTVVHGGPGSGASPTSGRSHVFTRGGGLVTTFLLGTLLPITLILSGIACLASWRK